MIISFAVGWYTYKCSYWNCSIFSKLLLQDWKFDIAYDNVVPLQNIVPVYMIFLRVLLLWKMGRFTPILHLQQHRRHAVLKNFPCRVHIIVSRQMKCETYEIFKSVFNLRVLYSTQTLFCPFDHLLKIAAQSAYLICLYSLTLNST